MLSYQTRVERFADDLSEMLGDEAATEAKARLDGALQEGAVKHSMLWFDIWTRLTRVDLHCRRTG